MWLSSATPCGAGGPGRRELVSRAGAQAAPITAGTIPASTEPGAYQIGPRLHGCLPAPARLRFIGCRCMHSPGFSGSHRAARRPDSACRSRGSHGPRFLNRQDPNPPAGWAARGAGAQTPGHPAPPAPTGAGGDRAAERLRPDRAALLGLELAGKNSINRKRLGQCQVSGAPGLTASRSARQGQRPRYAIVHVVGGQCHFPNPHMRMRAGGG